MLMTKLIPTRVATLFSRVATALPDFLEYSPAGRTPPACADPARLTPAKWFPVMRMAMLVLGLELLAGPGSALAQRPLGIDVSSYQGGSINWTSVKNSGVTFAWTKATEGTYYYDADFTINEGNRSEEHTSEL